MQKGKTIIILCLWLLIWEALARLVHNAILLAGPIDTLLALLNMLQKPETYTSILATLLRIAGGFFLGACAGVLLATASYRSKTIEQILYPFVQVVKSIPVASFVIIVLIWAGSKNVSLIICALVVFPILYLNTLTGLKATDTKMLEMACVFRIRGKELRRGIYYPQLFPFWKSACALALGMAWKSGVAAEVIGQPLLSMGNKMYRAKIYLDTAQVFAWTALVIFLSWLFEKAVLFALQKWGEKNGLTGE